MNKTAIKNFAIWARNKLIADITYKAGLLGITEKEIKSPLPQSTKDVQFFDIGTKEPYSITGAEIIQRRKLAEAIQLKAKQSDYKTAYMSVVEEVAYTWFNRLIAVRFMEVNDYLPSRLRVLSSESSTKIEPDLVTSPFEADLQYTPYEKDRIMQLKSYNQLDELFRMLFIKQCNALNAILPELFEKTNDYTELLMNVSFTDKDGVVYHLVHDIPVDDFNVEKEGQVEIIGWLYQYYNTEPKDETFALLKKNVKITKERIPAATQLFTPDWIVRYMVENSLGRLWLEGHPNDTLKSEWKYYLEEADQEPEVVAQLAKIREEYKTIKPEEIKVIDPCMGSGHILVYAFDVLMQIYESCGYSQRDAAKSIVENNLYGLDIDNRAYQLAYFAVMMKARQYNRRILNGDTKANVYDIQESNFLDDDLIDFIANSDARIKADLQRIRKDLYDAKEYGSILNVSRVDFSALHARIKEIKFNKEIDLFSLNLESGLLPLVQLAEIMAQTYHVVVTNPPYMGDNGMSPRLIGFLKDSYNDYKIDMFSCFIDKCRRITTINGYFAMITMQSWMFLSSFEKLRKDLVKLSIENFLHIGFNSFPELNSKVALATAFVIKNSKIKNFKGKYFDLTQKYPKAYDKQKAFEQEMEKHTYYAIASERFNELPSTQIAFWAKEAFFDAFKNGNNILKYVNTFQGIITGNNTKYLRLWYELDSRKLALGYGSIDDVNVSVTPWIPYNKGGDALRWYGNHDYVIDWTNGANDKTRGKKKFSSYYLQEYVSWAYISLSLSTRYYPEGFLWDVSGSGFFSRDKGMLFYMLGLTNSIVGNEILKIINSTLNYQVENIAQIPVLVSDKDSVVSLVKENVNLAKIDWDSFETSWNFTKHPLVQSVGSIKDIYASWKNACTIRFEKLKNNEESLNKTFLRIYNLDNEFTSSIEDKIITIHKADLKRDIKNLISYAVGCMLGRYSLDADGLVYAGGEWDDSKYSIFIPDKDNILPITDEEYFDDDIVGLFCAFLKETYGAEAQEENLDFIAKALGNKGNSSREIIRNYFLNGFFEDHCSTYSVTGSGKRPIYWLFDSGKADGFKALIYMHRYNEDTIGNLRIDYLHRMQRVYESEIARMQETIENSTNAREVTTAQKRKEKLIKQLKETKEYDVKIAHLALSRIAIDLDDGVKVNYEKVQTGTDGIKLEVLAKI